MAIDLAVDDEDLKSYLEKQIQLNNIDVKKCREIEFNLMMNDCSKWLKIGKYLDVPHPRNGATALHVAASKGYNQLIGKKILVNF